MNINYNDIDILHQYQLYKFNDQAIKNKNPIFITYSEILSLGKTFSLMDTFVCVV